MDGWEKVKVALCEGLEGENLIFAYNVFEGILDNFEPDHLHILLPVANQLLVFYHITRETPQEFLHDAFDNVKIELNEHNEYETTIYTKDFDQEQSESFSNNMFDTNAICLANIALHIKTIMVPILH